MFVTDCSNHISSLLTEQCLNKSKSFLGDLMDMCLSTDSLLLCKPLWSLLWPFWQRGGERKYSKGMEKHRVL